MAVSLSLLAGAGWQFLDDNANPLTGGLLYTYAAGTTTPLATYTSSSGSTPNANPIVLDAAGRVSQEVWLTTTSNYKFILKNSTGVTIWTKDDIPGGLSSDAVTFLQAGTGAVERTAQAKMRDVVSVKDFGAVGDGVTDDTTAFVNALTSIAAQALTVAGYKTCMPNLYIPKGRYRITQKKALSSAFQSGGIFRGITFFGDGRYNTEIYYDSANTDADNYLASFRNCIAVEFQELAISFSGAGVLRGIEWHGASGPQGTDISFKNVSVIGDYKVFFDVTGSSLGSETYWENLICDGPTAGNAFFNVTSNAQSVNHLFINCTISCRGGTVLNFNAGGNFKWYGGYTSFIGANPGTFLNIVGAGAAIGSTNWDFLIDGWHPETASGNLAAVMLNLNASGFVTFRACNFNQPTYPVGHYPFVIGQTNQQRDGTVNFTSCTGITGGKMQLNGGVTVSIDGCDISTDWQNFIEFNNSTVSNQFSPSLTIRNSTNIVGPGGTLPSSPRDCRPFGIERLYSAVLNPVLQRNGQPTFIWMGKSGNQNGNGLVSGYNSAYASFTFKIPLGSILKKVIFKYIRNGDAYPGADRTYKVTDNSGSNIFIAETTFAGAGPTTIISSDLWYAANDETSREIIVYGKSTTGSSPGSTHSDVGYVVVEYV